MACTFSTSQLPKVVRTCGVLYILTWKCASRHNGVQFFIAPVASWLCTRDAKGTIAMATCQVLGHAAGSFCSCTMQVLWGTVATDGRCSGDCKTPNGFLPRILDDDGDGMVMIMVMITVMMTVVMMMIDA